MPPGQDNLPARFGPFALLEALGAGGMGTAYLALHIETRRLLVVKRLHRELEREEVVFRRFVHEARAASHVCHENVAAMVAMGRADAEPFLATEYVSGVQLGEVVGAIESGRAGPVPLALGLTLALGLARGLAAIHGARHRDTGEPLGLIHRDIGARNILVGFDGWVRIIDLGLGKSVLADWQTASKVLAGSPDYMPPEQALGARVDARADVYSTAVTIWELLAGRKRIREEHIATRLSRAIEAQPEPLRPHRAEATARLEATLQKAMHPSVERRTASAESFAGALAGALVAAGGPAPIEQVAAWVREACAPELAEEEARLARARADALQFAAVEDARADDARDHRAVRDSAPSSGSHLTGLTEFFVGAPTDLGTHGASPALLARDPGGADPAGTPRPAVPSSLTDHGPGKGRGPSPYDFYGEAAAVPPALADAALEDRGALAQLVRSTAERAQPADRSAGRPSPPGAGGGRRVLASAALGLALIAWLCWAAVLRPRADDRAANRALAPPGAPPGDGAEAMDDPPSDQAPSGRAPADPAAATALLPGPLLARKEALLARIRRLRRVRFDVDFQRRLTGLSTALTQARTRESLDEIEQALRVLDPPP